MQSDDAQDPGYFSVMNPRGFMAVQAALVLLLEALGSLTSAGLLVVLASLTLGVWGYFLQEKYRKASCLVAGRVDDSVVIAQLSLILLGALVATTQVLWHFVPVLTHRSAFAVLIAAVYALFAVLFASSLVDWYYVRPRVDGVIRSPPCRSSGDSEWLQVSRAVFAHRGVAEIVSVVAIVVTGTAAVVAVTHPPASAVATIAGVALVGLGALLQGAIQTVQTYAINKPWLGIGDLLVEKDGTEHYVVEIATSGVYVRQRTQEEGWSRLRPLSLKRIESESFAVRPAVDLCASCEKLNPNCAIGIGSANADQAP